MCKKLLVLCIACLVLSCASDDDRGKQKIIILEEPSVLEIADLLELDGITDIINPREIINIGESYLLTASNREEGFFQVFSLPDSEYLYSWGRRGGGPDEFYHTGLFEINAFENVISVFHLDTQMLRYYTVNDSTLVRLGESKLSYENQADVLNNIYRLRDSVYIVDYGDGPESVNEEHVILKTGQEEPLLTFGNYPDTELPGFERYFDFIKTGAVNPSGTRFVASYLYHNLLKIYSDDGELIHEIEVDDNMLPQNYQTKDSFQLRTIEAVTDNYIYALGWNEQRSVISDQIESHINSIEIWDWEGNSHYRAMFDRPIHGFTVSEEHGLIIGYSHTEMNELYRYDLPSFRHIAEVE
jgi:hypothetical protein